MHTARRCPLHPCVCCLTGVFLRTQEISQGGGLWVSLTRPGESYGASLGWRGMLACYHTILGGMVRRRRRRGRSTALALSASRVRPSSTCCNWTQRSTGGNEIETLFVVRVLLSGCARAASLCSSPIVPAVLVAPSPDAWTSFKVDCCVRTGELHFFAGAA